MSKRYLSIPRLHAYIEQYKYVEDKDQVLEIGNGAGVFGNLVSKIATYKVIDINNDTKPDFVADISKWNTIEKHKNKYDIIFCCQVLEHMPWDISKVAIDNLASLNAKKLIISIPDNRKRFRIKLRTGGIKIEKVFSYPFSGKDVNINNDKNHYWEIWHKNYEEILLKFNNIQGYTLIQHYRMFERTYQHFFILERI